MAVLAIFRGPGITQAMYQSLRTEVDWETRNPAGAIFHAATIDEKGDLHVADMWESAELMNAFFAERLLPAMQKLHIPPPSVEVYPVINATAYRGVERYIVKG